MSAFHPHDPVHALAHPGIVGDDDEGLVVLPVELHQEVHDIIGGLGIQIAGGLVGPHDGRTVHQAPGDGHPLLLATAELGGLLMGLLFQSDHLQHLQRADPCLRWFHPPHQERELHVLHGGQHREEIEELEDEPHAMRPESGLLVVGHGVQELPLEVDCPLVEVVQPAQTVQHGGLSATAGSHDPHHLSRTYRQIDPPESMNLHFPGVVDLVDVTGLNDDLPVTLPRGDHGLLWLFEHRRTLLHPGGNGFGT